MGIIIAGEGLLYPNGTQVPKEITLTPDDGEWISVIQDWLLIDYLIDWLIDTFLVGFSVVHESVGQ